MASRCRTRRTRSSTRTGSTTTTGTTSNNFIYKVAGSDGCLPQATDLLDGRRHRRRPNNLPENYNGAQEFYSWWKGVGTTHTPQPNGELGKCITARDHLFTTRSWQLNDAELTIPGAVCAGQQVMLASHNDSTPVGDGHLSGATSGSDADERHALGQLGQRLRPTTRTWART